MARATRIDKQLARSLPRSRRRRNESKQHGERMMAAAARQGDAASFGAAMKNNRTNG